MVFAVTAVGEEHLKIEEVVVLTSDSRLLRIIDKSTDLARAEREWGRLQPVPKIPNTIWTHKFDIKSNSIGGRWLYNEAGYLVRLNKRLTPKYKVVEVEKFNRVFLRP